MVPAAIDGKARREGPCPAALTLPLTAPSQLLFTKTLTAGYQKKCGALLPPTTRRAPGKVRYDAGNL